MLDSWRDGPAKAAITDFVDRVTTRGGLDFVAPEELVAVFDNNGTLWCEKPAHIQLDLLVRRRAEQAATDPSLQAGADLGTHRATPDPRGGQLQRRHRDAAVHPGRRAVAMHAGASR